jgi:hypothetical protein
MAIECLGNLEVEPACHVEHIQVVSRFDALAHWDLRASGLGRLQLFASSPVTDRLGGKPTFERRQHQGEAKAILRLAQFYLAAAHAWGSKRAPAQMRKEV